MGTHWFHFVGNRSIPLYRRQRDALLTLVSALMLAVESRNVIDIRLWRIATGHVDAAVETRLMISEKIDAAITAVSMMGSGSQMTDVIDFYRGQVASNAERLA